MIKIFCWKILILIVLKVVRGEEHLGEFLKYKPLIEGISNALVDRYGASCGTILHSNNRHAWFENRQIELLAKNLTMDKKFEQPVLVSTFEDFITVRKGRTTEQRCPKVIFLILGWFAKSASEFAELTHEISLKGSIWLIFLHRGTTTEKFFEKTNTPFNANMIVAKLGDFVTVELEEVYRVAKGYPLRILKYGMYNNGKLTHPKQISLYSRRNDLEGYPIRASTKDDVPICSVYRDADGKLKIGGYFGAIFYELAQQLNFTPVFVEARENVTGSQVNGVWNGILGMLQRNEIDFAAGPMTYDINALPVASFVRPLLRTNLQVFFKQAGDVIIWDSILKPFGSTVWFLILGWFILGALFLHVFYRIGCKFESEQETLKDDFSKLNSFFLFLKAFCYQSSAAIPESWPCRLLFITGYLMSTVLVTAYSAALISHLTTNKAYRPFDTLQGLYDDGTYTLTAIDRSTEYTYFSDSNQKLQKAIFEKMMKKIPEDDLPGGKEEGIEQVCYRHRYALFITFAVTQITARQYNEERDCKILHFTNPLDKVFLTIGRNKNFLFTDLIEFYLQIMESSGILQRLQKKEWPLERKETKETFFQQVTIDEVIQVHTVLIMGMTLSVIMFLLEKLHYHLKNKKPKIKKNSNADVYMHDFNDPRSLFSKFNNVNMKSFNKENGHVKNRKKIIFIH